MKIKIPVFLCLLLLVFLSSSCEKPIGAKVVYSFWVENHSSQPISFHVSERYPDTSIPAEFKEHLKTVDPGKRIPYDMDQEESKYFEQLPKDTLSIFFFDPDTLSRYSENVIIQEYKVIERRDFGLPFLEANEFTIDYPK